PKKVAIGVTSYNGPFYPDGANTGAFYTEVYHPFKAFTEAGFDVDLVSETGSFGWDEHSLEPSFTSAEELAASKDKSNPFAKAISSVKKASSLDAKEYGIINIAGGHATIFDFDGKAPGLANFASELYANGGLVVAVCHGPCLLPDVKDKSTGKSIAYGKEVTGFPDDGETAMGLYDYLTQKNLAFTAALIKAAGAKYQVCNPPFDAKVVKDGRLSSGANPASAHPAAEAAIKAFASL
ncbi:molecular chaperone Hsp31, partial [Macrococcus caseolyticus]